VCRGFAKEDREYFLLGGVVDSRIGVRDQSHSQCKAGEERAKKSRREEEIYRGEGPGVKKVSSPRNHGAISTTNKPPHHRSEGNSTQQKRNSLSEPLLSH